MQKRGGTDVSGKILAGISTFACLELPNVCGKILGIDTAKV
jgi:hypothetical protein